MNRRAVLKLLGATSAVAIIGGGMYEVNRKHPELSLESTLIFLKQLTPEKITSTGQWPLARAFEHLAQSIEFSMIGYPIMKSEFFQNTAGSIAFSVFNARGKMNHGLDEIIPGEVIRKVPLTVSQALTRLVKSLEDFNDFSGVLKPHFAYGQLTKQQYALAHVMHINNHFEEFNTTY